MAGTWQAGLCHAQIPGIDAATLPRPSRALTLVVCLFIAVSGSVRHAAAAPQEVATPGGSARTTDSAGSAPAGPAETPETREATSRPASLRIHGVILAAGTSVLIATGALEARIAPTACRWCDLDASGTDSLNGFDRRVRGWWRWDRAGTAHAMSSVLAFGVVPATAIGLNVWAARDAGLGANAKVDALVVCEAVVLAASSTQLVKYLTARQRPYAHARALGQPSDVPPGTGDNLSFTSDHTATAFAIAVSGARVATLRHYARAGWIWRIAVPAAAAVGYFRIAADRHYATDVLAGAGLGSAIGWVVPQLASSERAPRAASTARVTIEPVVTGAFAGVRCAW